MSEGIRTLKVFNSSQASRLPSGKAVKDKFGTYYVAPNAHFHADILEAASIDPDDVESFGWIENGAYNATS